MNKKLYQKKGSLIVALLVIFVLIATCTAFLLRYANESWLTFRVANSTAALWAAEAGLQKVMWEYNRNNCNNMSHADANVQCNGDKTIAGTLTGYGDYDATLDSANQLIQSVGSIPSRTAFNRIQRRVKATLAKPPIFSFGMFAQGKVTLKQNSVIDAYNSTLGAYGGINVDHTNGNVGTNGATAGIVEIDNNADVWGNVSTGPGGTVTENGTVHGTISSTNSVPLPAVVVPSSLTSLASGGTLNVSNNGSQTINGGDYKYTNITLGNNSTLSINGNVRLYLTGNASQVSLNTGTAHVNLNIADGATLQIYSNGTLTFDNNTTINTASHKPSNLQIYSTYTGDNGISISNNSATYAAVYAPQTDIAITNNAGFYGAVVGKTATLLNNGDVHYDMALASLANPFETSILSNWQEY